MAYENQLARTTEQGSRIDNDAAQLRTLAERVHTTRTRVMRHAKSLGYWAPTPEPGQETNKLAPVSSTLQDGIRDLEKAVEELSGALNVFD